jgi:hypothetical protein
MGGQALFAGGEDGGGVHAVAPATITRAAASATTTLALRITILEIVCFIFFSTGTVPAHQW